MVRRSTFVATRSFPGRARIRGRHGNRICVTPKRSEERVEEHTSGWSPPLVEAMPDTKCPWALNLMSKFTSGAALGYGGKKAEVEELWRGFFLDPTEWKDHRSDKPNPRFPDFKHRKHAEKVLWLNSKWMPSWVKEKLVSLPPGSVQSSAFSWNQQLLRYAQAGQYEKTIEVFQKMQGDGQTTDRFSYAPVLKACSSLGLLEHGRCIHTMMQPGFEADLFIGTCLVDMYSKCGSIEEAEMVFNQMPRRDVVTFNAMIGGYVKCGEGQKALKLFEQMQVHGVNPNAVTFVGVLNACASVAAIEGGKRVHEEIIRRGFESDVAVGTCLVDMYAKCGSVVEAEVVFNQMPARDVVTFNAMIGGYVKCGEGQRALELFEKMQCQGVDPNPVTFVGVLNACASVAAIEGGRRAHEEIIRRSYELDVFVGTSLVDMYSKCGRVEEAEVVFNQMPTRGVVTFNAMIGGYVKCGEGQKALELLEQMQIQGVDPNPVTFVGVLNACASGGAVEGGKCMHEEIIRRGYESDILVGNSLVDMYTKCGRIHEAEMVFNQMPTRDVVTFSAMIGGYVKCGEGQKALELFEQMQGQGVDPNPVTFVGVLNACASIAAIEGGRRVHKEIICRGYDSDVIVGNCLVDMYAKCGSINEAERVFNKMPTRDVVTWTVMLAGYGIHGQSRRALETFKEMCKVVKVNGVTFISLLSACSHGGLVAEGLEYFKSMIAVYNITPTPEHFSCVVDILGRAGRLREAEDLIMSMTVNPNATVWMALLGACRAHVNVEVGERCVERVLELEPCNAAAYVLLSDIYVAAGKLNSSARLNGEVGQRCEENTSVPLD